MRSLRGKACATLLIMKNEYGYSVVIVIVLLFVLIGVVTASVYIMLQDETEGGLPETVTGESRQIAWDDDESYDQQQSLVRSDLMRLSVAIDNYALDNNGNLPQDGADLNNLMGDYFESEFVSPLTNEPYALVDSNNPEVGVIAVIAGAICSEEEGQVNEYTPRSFALLTALENDSIYCLSNN